MTPMPHRRPPSCGSRKTSHGTSPRRAYFDRTRRLTADGADPPTHAAELAAFLLSSASRGITGKLISAQWDPWRDSSFQDRLRADRDLATIRRVDDQFFAAKER